MFLSRIVVTYISVLFLLFVSGQQVWAVSAGGLRTYATHYSIGIEWDVSADSNHNSSCSVFYRQEGQGSWLSAMDLFRVDFSAYDMLAGSLFFLAPGKTYEIRLQLLDPDGGGTERVVTQTTRVLPNWPAAGNTIYVIPGSGGGSGTTSDPYQGISTAQEHAAPGDTILLGGGTYTGEILFNKSGEENNYIVYKPWTRAVPRLETLRIDADHVWLEGLHIEGNEYGLRTYNNPEDIVLTKNSFIGCNYCIYLNHGGTGWYIGDNTIIGNVSPASGSFSGEGIELNHSDDHTVLYNSISMVADGVSYPGSNCDIFGNDIFDTSDDGIEIDYGYVNNRVFRNRISNAYHNGISFQPMNGAPWYVLYNQVAAPIESALKYRDAVDRHLLAHNTFVGWQGAQKSGSDFLLAAMSRNNLWISMTPWYAWENSTGNSPDWRTDVDYDGFDWSGHVYAIKWGLRYSSIGSFAAATGMEQHGIAVDKESCFSAITIPNSPPASMPKQHLTLEADCEAVDYGVKIPNINDNFKGTAPDLGAYERGAALPHYGPRVSNDPPPGPTPSGKTAVAPLLLPLLMGEKK